MPESGRIVRLVLYAQTEAHSLASGHVLDYSEVDISGVRYVLPKHSSAYVSVGVYESREEISFRNHRKFNADSEISFVEDPGASGKPSRATPDALSKRKQPDDSGDRRDEQ